MRAPMILAVLAGPALVVAAHAATLREADVTLRGQQVRLSDLFAGVVQDRVIGPAPEPGGRIVVESAQLGAIARQFLVDWRPASTADRLVLERPGRQFPREPVLAALREALLAAGMPGNADIEIPPLTPPMVPPDDSARPDVTEAAYNPSSGRFTALLSITAAGMAPFNARLSGHVQEMVDVAVTTRRLSPGDVITGADIQPARVRAGLVRSDPVHFADEAVGMAARHALSAGVPLLLADLGRPALVQRGSQVQVEMRLPGLAVSVQGVAMESAAAGERVHVVNPTSRAVMEAEVTGPLQARVTMGSSPVLLPPGAPMPRPSPVRVAVR